MTTTAPPPSQESVFWFSGFSRNDHKEPMQAPSPSWDYYPNRGRETNADGERVEAEARPRPQPTRRSGRHSRSFPLSSARRSDAPTVQGGGDLAKQLRPCGL